MVELENVTKMYGKRIGIQDLSMIVNRGEVVGLLGPNGAGKTTTMRIVTGYMPPTSGRVRVAGFDAMDEPREVKRRIGYLPEVPPLYPDMTVRAFLEFVAKVKSVPRARRRGVVDDAIDRAGLTEVAGRLIGNLSRGYRQRVGIAQAILADPDLLVLDEPTNGLDPKQVIEIRQLIQSLAKNQTILLSSHILPEVSMICDRVAIINRGRLVAQDTPAALSRALRSGRRLRIEVEGPVEKVRTALRAIPGVVGVTVKDGTESGDPSCVNTYLIESGEEDVRRAVFRALAAADTPLLHMEPEIMSLEQIFIELITEETFSSGSE